MQISSKTCKTACKAKSGCNSVNYHEGQKICELLDCGLHRSPPNYVILLVTVYMYGNPPTPENGKLLRGVIVKFNQVKVLVLNLEANVC